MRMDNEFILLCYWCEELKYETNLIVVIMSRQLSW
jgi:hypothetical protein